MTDSFNYTSKAGLAPGTPVYVGDDRDGMPAALTRMLCGSDPVRMETVTDFDAIPEPEQGVVNWYDFCGLHRAETVQKVCRKFGVHPLSMEDIVNCNQRPKCESFDKLTFVTLKEVSWSGEFKHIEEQHISMIAGENLILTFRESGMKDPFARLRERLSGGDTRIGAMGADYLCFLLLDVIVDGYYLILEKTDDLIGKLQEYQSDAIASLSGEKRKRHILARLKVFGGEKARDKDTEELNRLRAIYDLRRELHAFRRAVFPVRDAVLNLSSLFAADNAPVVPYLRDLADHVAHVLEDTENQREMTGGLSEMALGIVSFRMNAIMKTLAMLTAIFIPLSFIAGVYGMNFKHMPETEYPYGYYTVLTLMFVLGVSILLYFRRKRWI